jgi:ABC-2 type transport system permease protein
MSEIFIITKTRIKLLLRKKLLLALCLILPIVFYFIAGEIFSKSEAYNKIPIALIDEDNTEISKLIVDKLKSNDSLKCYEESIDKALKSLEENEIEGVYLLKKGLKDKIESEDINDLVDVYYLPQNTAAVGLTDMVAGEIMPVVCSYKVGALGEKLYKQYKHKESLIIKEKIISYSNELEQEETFKLPIIFKSISSKVSSADTSKFDRSELGKRAVVGMLVFFNTLFILSNYSSIMRERTNNIYRRIKSTGVSKLSILCADTLGIIIVGSLMGIIQVGLLYPVFKFKSILGVLAIIITYLIYTFCIASILILFTRIFKNYVTMQGFIPQFTFFIALLGGCLLGIELIPGNIRVLSILSPTYWANDALTKLILKAEGINSIYVDLIILTAMGTLYSTISLIKEKNFGK